MTSHWTFPLASGQFIFTLFVRSLLLFFSLVSFTLQYHMPPTLLSNIYRGHYSVPTSADAPTPSFLTVPIHSVHIPACHPESHVIRLSDTRTQFQMSQMYIRPKGLVVFSIGQHRAIPLPPPSPLFLRELSAFHSLSTISFSTSRSWSVLPCRRADSRSPSSLSLYCCLPSLSPRALVSLGRHVLVSSMHLRLAPRVKIT